MTKKTAIQIAIETLSNTQIENGTEVVETLQKMLDQLSAPRTSSPEAKAKANEKRKAATAAARTALVDSVAPILREVLSHTQQGLSAKEIFSEAQSRLPEDFTAPKVQSILLREMRPELDVIEAKGKANTYRLASAANE